MSLNVVVAGPVMDDNDCNEAYFSWQQCEECGSTLGGDRYDISYRETLTGPIYEASICVDCFMDLCG